MDDNVESATTTTSSALFIAEPVAGIATGKHQHHHRAPIAAGPLAMENNLSQQLQQDQHGGGAGKNSGIQVTSTSATSVGIGGPSPSTTVRDGDWTCPNCSANVFGRNISCFRCLSPKPGSNARHGDWVCLNKGCGAHNYASRQSCYRCNVPKGAEKPGDWPCPNCHSNNFASRGECFRCRVPRPPGFGPAVLGKIRPGDWICVNPSCGCNVFANRDTCFRCNTARPKDAELALAFSDRRAGDWTCANCSALCFAHRASCFRCETPKPEGVAAAPAASTVAIAASGPHHQGLFPYPYSVGYGNGGNGNGAYGGNYYAYYQQPNPYHRGGGMNMHHQGIVLGNMQFKRREGDWACAGCKEQNFARRNECFKCREPRPGVSQLSIGVETTTTSLRTDNIIGAASPNSSGTTSSWICTCGSTVVVGENGNELAVCPTCQGPRNGMALAGLRGAFDK